MNDIQFELSSRGLEKDRCPRCGGDRLVARDGIFCVEFGHGPFSASQLIDSEEDYEWVI